MEHLKVCKQQVRGVNPNVRVLFFQFVLPVHHGYNGLTQLHCRRDTAVRFLHRNCFQCITDTQRLHTVICINSYHTAFKCRNNSIPHAALAVLMWDFCSVTKMNCFDKIRFNLFFFLFSWQELYRMRSIGLTESSTFIATIKHTFVVATKNFDERNKAKKI